jgi:hypothetical protein
MEFNSAFKGLKMLLPQTYPLRYAPLVLLQSLLSSCLASNFMDVYSYLDKITLFILQFSGCILLESVITASKT